MQRQDFGAAIGDPTDIRDRCRGIAPEMLPHVFEINRILLRRREGRGKVPVINHVYIDYDALLVAMEHMRDVLPNTIGA